MARPSVLAPPLLSLTLAFASAFPLACAASAKDTEDRMLDKMSSEIDKAQPDTYDFAQTGGELGVDSGASRGVEEKQPATHEAKPPVTREAQQALNPSPPPLPAMPPAPMPTPRLRVVHVAPDGKEQTPNQDEPAPRLVLTNASLDRQHASHPPARGNAAPDDARHAYNAALELLNLGHYAAADEALTRLLIRWPDNANAADALYARAQCSLAQGGFANATQSLEALLARFPSSHRTNDARFELDQAKRHLADASPTPRTRSAYAAPPPPPRQAAPPGPPDARRSNGVEEEHDVLEDEDDEHIVPADEDNEHLVGGRER